MMNPISIGLIIQLTFLILTVDAQYRVYVAIGGSPDWNQAQQNCEDQGYDSIATIATDIDYAALRDTKDTAEPRRFRIADDVPFWVGLSRPSGGEFTWTDGTPCETDDGLCVSDWAEIPDISGDTEYCATLTVDSTSGARIYTASACDTNREYLCSYIDVTNAPSAAPSAAPTAAPTQAPTPAAANANPLSTLDWASIDLFAEISDTFKDATSSYESTGFDVMAFEVRTYDAIGNNLENKEWGSTNSQTPRCLPPDYEDGISTLAGAGRLNPREISNVIAKQIPEDDDKFVNDRRLTQFAWQWGQFIDHDVTLISEERSALDTNFHIDILVHCGDPVFDPTDTCDADRFIEVFRTLPFSGTGTDTSNPREQINEITSFVDASMIYGFDQTRAEALRSFVDGELLVTADNFMPYNFEENPIHNDPTDSSTFPIAGDVRASEQLGLLTMHTIWVRFHNLIAEEVAISVDGTSAAELSAIDRDEMIYQYTKLIVTAIVQKITYKDWLPALFGPTAISQYLGEYSEYNKTANAGACPIFSSAAFRFGHTLLPNFLPLRDEMCGFVEFDQNACPQCNSFLGGIELRDCFFVPDIAVDNDGFFEALLYGMICTLANEIDVSFTEGVRNFLLESALNPKTGNRLFGDLDLIAINLQRGREHGLPDYNTVREGMGLNRLTDFNEMTSDSELADNFEVMYGDIDDVDLFLAALAEDHFPDGSFGETISAVVLRQFKRFRDGDRFWYERYIKPGELLDFIESVTLKSVIESTTNIDNIGARIFQNNRAVSIFAGEVVAAKAAPKSVMGRVMDEEIHKQPQHLQQPESSIHHKKPQHPQQQPLNHHNYVDDNKHPQQQPPHSHDNGNDNNKYYQQPPTDSNPGAYVIQLTKLQMVIVIASIIFTVGCTYYSLHKCKKNQINRYRAVKYDTETE